MLRTTLVTLGAAAIACGAMAQPSGVPVCDTWLERLDACADKLPEGLQDDLRTLNVGARRHVRELIRDVNKREAETICRENLERSRRAKLHQEYGCRF